MSDGRTDSVKQVVKFSLLLYGEDVGTAANQSIGIGINGGGDPYWEMKMDSSSERASRGGVASKKYRGMQSISIDGTS